MSSYGRANQILGAGVNQITAQAPIAPLRLASGRIEIVSGQAQPLSQTTLCIEDCEIKSLSTNSGNCYVTGVEILDISTVGNEQGYELEPGQRLCLSQVDLSQVWIDGEEDDDILIWGAHVKQS